MTELIRILIADDHLVVRKGFTYLLKLHKDLLLVGEANNGKEAVQLSAELQPSVILMDLKMPELDGIQASRIIRESYPKIQIVALTSYESDMMLVQEALEAGAISFLYKDSSADELVNAIRLAHQGQPYLSPTATRNLIQAKTSSFPSDYKLSERELDVLRLMAEGMSNGQIAEKLTISSATIKFHVSSILAKLHASTRTEAVAIALQNDLLKK